MHRVGIPGGLRLQIWILMGLFLALDISVLAQDKQVKKEPIKQTAALWGAGMFKEYCAVCHGKDAKGDGPAAAALKRAPPDLTALAKRHDGKFPDQYVENVLRNGVKAPAHGDAEMPGGGSRCLRRRIWIQGSWCVRIASVMSYLKSVQVK